MSRNAAAFRQADVTRAMRGAQAAGMQVTRVEIEPDGKIVVSSDKSGAPTDESPLEVWRRENGQS